MTVRLHTNDMESVTINKKGRKSDGIESIKNGRKSCH